MFAFTWDQEMTFVAVASRLILRETMLEVASGFQLVSMDLQINGMYHGRLYSSGHLRHSCEASNQIYMESDSNRFMDILLYFISCRI